MTGNGHPFLSWYFLITGKLKFTAEYRSQNSEVFADKLMPWIFFWILDSKF